MAVGFFKTSGIKSMWKYLTGWYFWAFSTVVDFNQSSILSFSGYLALKLYLSLKFIEPHLLRH